MRLARHGYFVVQARAETVGAELRLSGVVENLATADKWTFRGPNELIALLTQWGRQVSPSALAEGPEP